MNNSPEVPKIGVAASIGRRPSMEDRHVVLESFMGDPMKKFVGVFDGHGGSKAAQLAAQLVPSWFHRLSYDNYYQNQQKTVPYMLKEAFLVTDREVKRQTSDGATGLVLYQDNNLVAVACAGDSLAVLETGKGSHRLNYENKARNDSGIFRATRAGGYVAEGRIHMRGAGGIAVSRAIGDRDYKTALTAEPNVVIRALQPQDRSISLVCDGITDVITDAQIVQIVKNASNAQMASVGLVNAAYARGSKDNLTAVVVKFPQPPKKPWWSF